MKPIPLASLALAALLAAPAVGYHIDPGFGVGGSDPGDWLAGGGAPLCESNGPTDDKLANPVPREGVGGLCTTGRNDATGTLAPASAPAAGSWTRLDVCDATTASRMVGWAVGPCSAGVSGRVPTPHPFGATADHFFRARVGAFECDVPIVGSTVLVAQTATADYALYYDEKYAWWSHDLLAPSTFTGTDAPGAPHAGDGQNPPGVMAQESAFHGHVAVTLNMPMSAAGASARGSVETTAVASLPAGLSDTPNAGLGGVSNDCGGSSSAPTPGPVVRAP